MNALPHLDKICKRVAESYKKAYGDDVQGIYLYGSYARGDFDEDSDLDFVANVNGERSSLQQKLYEVWDDTNSMDLEFDTVTQASVIPLKEFAKYKNSLPYYRNIAKEGRRIDRLS